MQGNFFSFFPLSNPSFRVSPTPLPTPSPLFCRRCRAHSRLSSAPHLAACLAHRSSCLAFSLRGAGRGLIGGAESLKLAEAGHAHVQTLGKRTTHPPVNSAGLAWPRLRRHDVTGRTRREGCRDRPKMAGRFGSASVYLAEPHSLPCC